MFQTFLSPRVERMSADGAFQRLHEGGALGRLRPPVVLLARNLGAFAYFDGRKLNPRHRALAARTHAQAASPYVAGGTALSRCATGYGIWWWNLEQVLPLLGTRHRTGTLRLRPETLAQPRGNGWRIVKLPDGYEAQYWEAGCLMASSWRRERFDGSSWSAFTRLQRTDLPAPEVPPAAVSLPLAFDSEALSITAVTLSRNQLMGLAAGVAATALSVLVMFTIGQALTLRQEAADIAVETAALRTETARLSQTQTLEADRRRLLAFRQIEQQTNPVAAAGAAIGILALYDITPRGVNAEQDTLTLSLPYSAVERSGDLIAEFEASGYFYDVRPRTEAANGLVIMEMKVREAAPPLSADG